MPYSFTTDFGGGVILAPCLQALCAEIKARYPGAVNLGEIGDAAHRAEGYGSDHNPFVEHAGKRYVRAVDIGGPDTIQLALFNFFQHHYAAHDARVWPYGYVHRNNVITTWFGTGTHFDPGDVGHLHISVTQANGHRPSPAGWVPALDSRSGWGLSGAEHAPAVVPHPTPIPGPAHVPAWPLKAGNYFGLLTGPAVSHGGFYASERPYISLIQQRINALGYGRIAADGKFGPRTRDAVAKWQHAKWAKQTSRPGEVWSDDWKRLFA